MIELIGNRSRIRFGVSDSGSDVSEGGCSIEQNQLSRSKKEAGVSFRQFIRNRDHILRRNLCERFLQRLLQFRIVGSRFLFDDVTLSLGLHVMLCGDAIALRRTVRTDATARAAARPALQSNHRDRQDQMPRPQRRCLPSMWQQGQARQRRPLR